MAETEIEALLRWTKTYAATAQYYVTNHLSPRLEAAKWEVEVCLGYISNLPEGIRETATAHLSKAYENINDANGFASSMLVGVLKRISEYTGEILTAHLLAIEKARNDASVDIEKLVIRIGDNTSSLLSQAVQSVVDNIYNVQDTITQLLAGGYKYIAEVFASQLDRIPAAVWGYLDKYLFEKVK